MSYFIRFLAEVSLSANINKMTPHNLSIVFSPNLMRPRVDNPATIAEEMKYCLQTVETLLLEHMSDSIRESIALPSNARSGMGHRFSAVRRRGGSSADSLVPSEDNSNVLTATSILEEEEG